MSTNIQWTNKTDNIIRVIGGGWWCRMISPGCKNCYAAKLNQSAFFGGNKLAYTGTPPKLYLDEELIASWAGQTKSKKHFVASMTDVFGDWVPREWIFKFLDGMAAAPKQTFQVLTKRADIMEREANAWLLERRLERVPKHIWLGVSVENQECADERIPKLLNIPATRLLSVEPLLSAVCLRYPSFNGADSIESMEGIHWVIVGGESGKNARPCNVQWICDVVEQCKAANVPVFVKQLGKRPYFTSGDSKVSMRTNRHPKADGTIMDAKGGKISEWPEDLRIREFPTV